MKFIKSIGILILLLVGGWTFVTSSQEIKYAIEAYNEYKSIYEFIPDCLKTNKLEFITYICGAISGLVCVVLSLLLIPKLDETKQGNNIL